MFLSQLKSYFLACYVSFDMSRMRSRLWRLLRDAIFVVVIFQAPVAAETRNSFASCLPPIPPSLAMPLDVLREYRAELIIDYEQYFRAISTYVVCLDTERDAVLAEAREATALYANFLEVATITANDTETRK